jgi:hypothetical protein
MSKTFWRTTSTPSWVARHRFRRAAGLKDYRTAHLYTICGGKLAHCIEQPRDQDAFDEAWGPE